MRELGVSASVRGRFRNPDPQVAPPPSENYVIGAWAGVVASKANDRCGSSIGIGGHLAMPPLPHHRAYGSRTRRFDWVKLGQEHEVAGDQESRSSGCAGPVEPPGVRTCARTRSVKPAATAAWNFGTPRRRSSLKRVCPFCHCRQSVLAKSNCCRRRWGCGGMRGRQQAVGRSGATL